VKLEETTAGPD